jgi:NADH-quinone oxidoreductase subunit M
MNLLYLLGLPLITAVALLFALNVKAVKLISLIGASVQFVLALFLLYSFRQERLQGNLDDMILQQKYAWFPSLNINFHVGVDGISVAMIMLTAFVVLAGVLISWNVQKMTKEFYFLLILLSLGAYGFFISLDLFILFFFLEIAVIPKYLLIGIWGSGKKEYSANKLALMLMGGSSLVLVGMLGIYFAGGRTFDLLQLSQVHIPVEMQKVIFPFPHLGTRWSLICANSRFHVPRWYLDEAGWLWLLKSRNVFVTRRRKRIFLLYYRACSYCNSIWSLCYHDAEGLEIHQRIFFR